MNSVSFKKNLLGVQEELLRFAYKLTADRCLLYTSDAADD